MPSTIGIYIYDEVEVLDFAGPYEVFTTASRVHHRLRRPGSVPFKVLTVARTAAPIRARAGLQVLPEADFQSHPHLDALVVPGGVMTAELADPEVCRWIAARSAGAGLTASICTGAFLLAKAGLLEGKACTTHWEDLEDLRAMFPTLTVLANRRWVDEGAIITAAGISAGIDMSLHMVERLVDRELAVATAHQLEFDWREQPAEP